MGYWNTVAFFGSSFIISLILEIVGTNKGYVFGKLINIGFGSDYGYPGLKLEKGGSKIFGMVFQSKNLEKKLF